MNIIYNTLNTINNNTNQYLFILELSYLLKNIYQKNPIENKNYYIQTAIELQEAYSEFECDSKVFFIRDRVYLKCIYNIF